MKKIFKKVTVLALVIVLFLAPSTTVFAASQPVLYYTTDECKMYEYQPDPYFVSGGSLHLLQDTATSHGGWNIKAGKAFYPHFFLTDSDMTVRIIVISVNKGIIYDELFTSTANVTGTTISIPAQATDDTYFFSFNALSNVYVEKYGAVYY